MESVGDPVGTGDVSTGNFITSTGCVSKFSGLMAGGRGPAQGFAV